MSYQYSANIEQDYNQYSQCYGYQSYYNTPGYYYNYQSFNNPNTWSPNDDPAFYTSYDSSSTSFATNSSFSTSSNSSFDSPIVLEVPSPVQQIESEYKPKKVNKQSSSRRLPDRAVDILNEWYEDHINSPYATQEEKERLAMSGGITPKQVDAWLSNRRNRTRNTRPQRIQRQLVQNISSIRNDLMSSYNSRDEIIQKLNQVAKNF